MIKDQKPYAMEEFNNALKEQLLLTSKYEVDFERGCQFLSEWKRLEKKKNDIVKNFDNGAIFDV